MNDELGIHNSKGMFMEKKTILIVEDDVILGLQLKRKDTRTSKN